MVPVRGIGTADVGSMRVDGCYRVFLHHELARVTESSSSISSSHSLLLAVQLPSIFCGPNQSVAA